MPSALDLQIERQYATKQRTGLVISLAQNIEGHLVSVRNEHASIELVTYLKHNGFVARSLPSGKSRKERGEFAENITAFRADQVHVLVTENYCSETPRATHVFIFDADKILPENNPQSTRVKTLQRLQELSTRRLVLCANKITPDLREAFPDLQ